jgi:predicted DNA-binding transcriptional regulator YafY
MAEVRSDAGSRLERLLAVLSWLAQRGQVSLHELADRFGMTAEQLVADLELAACCGLPPYTPDRLMEIIVGEEMVEAQLGTELARPRRLSAQEGFALAAAARASAAVRGGEPDDSLARALTKLDSALGDRGLGDVDLDVDLGEPAQLATVRDAVTSGAQLQIDYLSAWRDARSTRVVDPARLAAYEGHWYLDAWCHEAGGTRRFRVDRILSATPTGKPVEHHDVEAASGSESGSNARSSAPESSEDGRSGAHFSGFVGDGPFVPGPEATLVRISVTPDSAWLVEAVPVIETSDLPDGRMVVTLGVVSTVWLERLLLQLGPDAEVLEPAEFKDLGREAAKRVLALYE